MIPYGTPLWAWCAMVTGVLVWIACPLLVAMLVRAGRRERRARTAARIERALLDRLAAPDGEVPPESLAAGRAALHAAVTTPDVDALRDLVGPVDWPETEDPR